MMKSSVASVPKQTLKCTETLSLGKSALKYIHMKYNSNSVLGNVFLKFWCPFEKNLNNLFYIHNIESVINGNIHDDLMFYFIFLFGATKLCQWHLHKLCQNHNLAARHSQNLHTFTIIIKSFAWYQSTISLLIRLFKRVWLPSICSWK